MGQRPERVTLIVQACCTLHNILRTRKVQDSAVDGPDEVAQEEMHIYNVPQRANNWESNAGKMVREQLKTYFNGEGAVTWQNSKVDF
jgi:hypothetical protein